MSKYQFLNDKRFMSADSRKKSIKRVFMLIIVFVLAIGIGCGAGFFGYNVYKSYSLEKSYKIFVALCETKDYDSAIEIYRRLQEKALTKPIIDTHLQESKNILLKMEGDVNKLIETPFNNVKDKKMRLTSNDINLMNNFQELSSRKLSDMIVTYLEDYLLGKQSKESVVFTFNELKTINSVSDTIKRYEKELDDIQKFTPAMKIISNEYKIKNYIPAASKMKNEIEKQSGFIKSYLTKLYIQCKNEMFKPIQKDIDVIMSSSKYYSAKSMIEQMQIFFPDDTYLKTQLSVCENKTTKKLIEYFKPIEHLSFRPLIATPGLAFDNDNYSKNAQDLMTTTNEFKRIIDQLYKNNYILIDINILVNSFGEKIRVFIPEGKIPVIISVEGLNYYAGRSKSGNSENLVLDKNGNVASIYKKTDGKYATDQNGELIGILDQFVVKHPDFSFDGAKGTISLTGFECIFGYVINDDQVDDRTKAFIDNLLVPFLTTEKEIKANREKVILIIKRLKETGWTFASSSYGSISFTDSSIDKVKADTSKWLSQVGELTGKVKTLLFPNGNFVGSKDPKGIYLIEKGFLIQCGIGPTAYFNYSGKNLYMDRITVNGITLRFTNLSRFFDVKTVYDTTRPLKLK